MLTHGKKECPFTDEIVSYMYGELDGRERDDFEMHLAECTTCTDDFAAISDSRFSVFEWRKEAFDRLATPSIVIPELTIPTTAANEGSGWFTGLAALLALARSPIAVATALLVFLGVGFIALAYFRTSEPLIATNANSKADVPPVTNIEQVDKKPITDLITETTIIPPDPTIDPTHVSVPRKRASDYKTPGAEIRRAVNNNPQRVQSPQMARKPVLNDFSDESDDSLRLTDLLDEIGG